MFSRLTRVVALRHETVCLLPQLMAIHKISEKHTLALIGLMDLRKEKQTSESNFSRVLSHLPELASCNKAD
jgi:hypothetical protein